MKSYSRTTAVAVSVLTGMVTPYTYANPSHAVLHAPADDAAQTHRRPMLQLSTSLSRTPAPEQAFEQTSERLFAPLALAMTTEITGTSGTGTGASSVQSDAGQPEHSKDSLALIEKYHQTAYQEVGKEGVFLLEKEPHNAELRLAVANSLAWTGAATAAVLQYEALAGTQYHSEALLGLGHVNRWSGRPDRAAQAYRRVLQSDPNNSDARAGLLLAERELRPATALRIGRAGNSDDSERTWSAISHAWRSATGARRYEVTAGWIDESNPRVDLSQRDLSLRYDDLDAVLTQADISAQQSPAPRLFGSVVLKPSGNSLLLHLGRINWGKLAFNPQALQDGLTANRLGAEFSSRQGFGNVKLVYHAYRVSDGNLVQDASAQLTPAMQPFRNLRTFVGVEARKSQFNDSRYWSPEEGQYSALVGLSGDWSNQWWQTSGSVQYGVPLTGESGRTWSAGFGVKRWLGESWAISADVWAIHTPRAGGYRSHSGSIRIEKLW